MARVYSWTEDEDEIAPDSITVGIRSDTRMLTIAGLQFGQREAIIYRADWSGGSQPIAAALEGPMPVQAALERAEALRSRYAFKRVVLWLQHRELWDEDWGNLSLKAGF